MPTATDYKRKLSTQRNWLLGNYRTSLELIFTGHAHSFSFSVLSLLSALLPSQVQALHLHAKDSTLIENQKGRDRPRSLHKEGPASQPIEELFRVTGSIVEPLTSIDASAGVDQDPDFFDVTIQTFFDSFGPQGSISHRAEVCTSSELLSGLRLNELPQAIPLRVESMRLGLELFQRSGSWTWFSRTPVVTTSLLIESSPSATTLLIESDSLKSRDAPLLPFPALSAQLLQAIKDSFSVDIGSELQIGVA